MNDESALKFLISIFRLNDVAFSRGENFHSSRSVKQEDNINCEFNIRAYIL